MYDVVHKKSVSRVLHVCIDAEGPVNGRLILCMYVCVLHHMYMYGLAASCTHFISLFHSSWYMYKFMQIYAHIHTSLHAHILTFASRQILCIDTHTFCARNVRVCMSLPTRKYSNTWIDKTQKKTDIQSQICAFIDVCAHIIHTITHSSISTLCRCQCVLLYFMTLHLTYESMYVSTCIMAL
jgi:hypothetical protein